MRLVASLLTSLTILAPLGCSKPPEQTPTTQPDPTPDPSAAECDFEADPDKRYVGESPDQCAAMRFVCEEGEEYFADDCGCGCLSADS